MNAVILCAGNGRRLYPLTEEQPKCLIEIAGKSILEYMMDTLFDSDIDAVTIVAGFEWRKIENLVETKGYPNVTFILNEKYETTNTAYSLNLALRQMDTDFILINGDVFLDARIVRDLIDHPCEDCIVVYPTENLEEEGVKVIVSQDKVVQIGKDLDPKYCLGEAIGVNKISASLIPPLSRVFDDLESRGEYQHFFEKGMDVLCRQNGRFGISRTDLPWVEIDTFEDLENAKRNVYPQIFASAAESDSR